MPKKKKTEQQSDTKDKALDLALANINKTYGQGAIVSLIADSLPGVEFISTGTPSIDMILGGGVARGRIVEVYGPESSGKTTLTLETIAQCQKEGGRCAFIDMEHALDPVYASQLGVDTDNLILSQPNSGEEALGITERLARTGALDLIVIDSVAALVPRAELEGDMGDHHVGLQARLMSQALRKLPSVAQQSDTTIIFINQIRMKIGVMFGNPETTSGGNALKFYASQRIEIRGTSKSLKGDNEELIARLSKVKVVKNKVAPPFRKTEVYIVFGKGIDKNLDLLNLAIDKGIVSKSGAWYSYRDENIGQGLKNACLYLEDYPDVANEIHQIILPKKE